MCRRTWLVSFVSNSISLMAGFAILNPIAIPAAFAQEAPASEFKKLEPKLKDKAAEDKRKEKDRARKVGEGKPDLTPLEEFYKGYLIPQLTSNIPEVINETRKEILDDISIIESNPELNDRFNSVMTKDLGELIVKDKNGKSYNPATRINAAIILGRLNSNLPRSQAPIPEKKVLTTFLGLLDPKELDGLSSSAMTTLVRHLKFGKVNDAGRKAFIAKLKPFLDLPPSPSRSAEAHDYLAGQAIECLTCIAKIEPDKETAQAAVAELTPSLIEIIDSDKSEWLVESALLSLGAINPPTLKPEELVRLEKGIAAFIRRSIKDWKQRISSSTSMSSGGSMGGPGSLGKPGASGGSPSGGSDEGVSGPAGGSPAGGGSSGPKNPFAEQPKETKNARRIAHQRFERIHLALNGLFKKQTASEAAATPAPTPKGLVSMITDEEKKAKVNVLIEKVEKFQAALNDEKIKELPSLSAAVSKPLKELKAAYEPLLGNDKPKVDEPEEKETEDVPF